MQKTVKLIIATIIPLIILFLPGEAFPIEGITIIEQRVIALFFLAALYWILEPIPVYATSVLIIVLELIMMSDKGFVLFLRETSDYPLGTLMSYQEILGTFASPIILLFLGGFFLAMAATKYRLDLNLARVLLHPFGENPKYVMMGLMIITAVFSMFMSNTATTAMMLSIVAPVLALFEPKDKGRIAFALCIPLAANIGGIGTPIGTPPNVIALKYLTGENAVTFSEWMSFGVPFVIILLVLAWIILTKFFPPKTKTIKLDIKGKFIKNRKAYLVYFTFSITILLWLTDFIHGMNSYVVAMIPVAVFTSSGIITKEDLKRISWDVLWLVSGGIALGLALEKSGLALHLVESIPFNTFSPYTILISCVVLTWLMANFMSHTASANLLMPIFAALGTAIDSLSQFGGVGGLIICTALAASMGMALPISTPPNALAHGTGMIKTNDMARIGILTGILGLLLSFPVIYILQKINII